MGKARVNAWKQMRDETKRMLDRLTDDKITEIDRRMSISIKPNGFPGSSRGGGGGSKGDHADPTYRIALDLVSGKHSPNDPQDVVFQRIAKALDGAHAGGATIIEQLRIFATIHEERVANLKVGEGICRVCDRYVTGDGFNKLKGGYCPSHHKAWIGWKKSPENTDRAVFEREWREMIAKRNAILTPA